MFDFLGVVILFVILGLVFLLLGYMFREKPIENVLLSLAGEGNAFTLHAWGGQTEIVQGLPVIELSRRQVHFGSTLPVRVDFCVIEQKELGNERIVCLRPYRGDAYSVVAVYADRDALLSPTTNVLGQVPVLLEAWTLPDDVPTDHPREESMLYLFCVPVGCGFETRCAHVVFHGERAELSSQ